MTNWTEDNIPNLEGKTIIVTGSSSGIGYGAALAVAAKGAKTIIAVRNSEKGNSAAERLRSEVENADVEVMILDLADLDSVKNFANEYKSKFDRLDVLINNAGVMVPPYSKTKNGFELQFGTNHLGHFVLTAELFDLITATEGSRIVNVSSSAHRYGNLNFDDLQWEQRDYAPWKAYGDSKISNIYFTNELDRRIKEAGGSTIVTSCHPGWTATDLQRNSGIASFLNNFFAQSIRMGTLPTLMAAFDENSTGAEYYGPNGLMGMRGYPVVAETTELARSKENAERLWSVSEELTGSRFSVGSKTETAAG